MRTTLGMMAVAVVALAGGCGDDEDAGGDGAERYCELAAELDAEGTEFFAALESDESATEEDFARAEQEFLDEHADDLEAIREAAPDEIAADIEVLLAAQEERAAGGEQTETPPEVSEAEERVLAFESEHCGTG